MYVISNIMSSLNRILKFSTSTFLSRHLISPRSYRQIANSSLFMSKNKKSSNKKPEAAAAVIEDNSDKAIFLNKAGEICLSIQAKPGSKDTSITDIQPDAINVRIAAPPVDGEANKELIKYISKTLNLRQSDVNLDKGSRNRNKVLIVSNCKMNIDEITNKLKAEIG